LSGSQAASSRVNRTGGPQTTTAGASSLEPARKRTLVYGSFVAASKSQVMSNSQYDDPLCASDLVPSLMQLTNGLVCKAEM
jgi:hypothetical protein